MRLRLKSRWKDWRRCRALARHGIVRELEVETFAGGARSGVWVVHSRPLDRDSVIYSFGVGDNVAWDLAMIERFGCTVQAFDPTPEAARFVAAGALPEQFVFHAVGLGDRDGVMRFCAPAKAGRPNFVCDHDGARFPAARTMEAPVERLTTVMERLGHERVDVLKIDIEGGEYAVFEDLFGARAGPAPRIGQLLVEFHHNMDSIPFERTARALRLLRAAGFRIFHISERGLEFSLLHESLLG